MAANSNIGWTESTWNPVKGCLRVSDGCIKCYAERLAARFSGPGAPFDGFVTGIGTSARWTGRVEVQHDALDQPIRWRKPRRIFCASMSDWMHERLDDTAVARILGHAVAAARLRGHTFQMLTKRAERQSRTMHSVPFWNTVNGVVHHLLEKHRTPEQRFADSNLGPLAPPRGIWIGVSAENQETADERIPYLLATPAATRFVSAEPLLGPINFRRIAPGSQEEGSYIDAPAGDFYMPNTHGRVRTNARIDWIITGGESGAGARPTDPDWMRAIRDDCRETAAAFFCKQMGGADKARMPPIPDDLKTQEWPDGAR